MIVTFLAYMTLEVAAMIAAFYLVPAWHRWIYHNSRKDWYCKLAVALDLGVVGVSILQWILSPDALVFRRQAVGAAMMAAGLSFVVAAWRVNPYFLPALVVVPKDRLVTDGIYRYFAHPGYVGMALAIIGKVLLFGQIWAVWPATLYLVILLWRVEEENRKVL